MLPQNPYVKLVNHVAEWKSWEEGWDTLKQWLFEPCTEHPISTKFKHNCPKCPQCGAWLLRVRQSENSPLNREQFDAVKAGDYYCSFCKGDEGKTGYKYYWERELEEQKENIYHEHRYQCPDCMQELKGLD